MRRELRCGPRRVLAVALLAGALLGAQTPQETAEEMPANQPLLRVGDEAPLFGPVKVHNPKAAGMESVSLGDYVGREPAQPQHAVVLTFLASWCEPCKRDLPVLIDLDRRHRGRGVKVIAVSIDREDEGLAAMRGMIERFDIRFPVAMDRHALLVRRYLGERTAMPSVFVIRRDGTFALVRQGYEENAADFLPQVVESLLPEAPPPAEPAPTSPAE